MRRPSGEIRKYARGNDKKTKVLFYFSSFSYLDEVSIQ